MKEFVSFGMRGYDRGHFSGDKANPSPASLLFLQEPTDRGHSYPGPHWGDSGFRREVLAGLNPFQQGSQTVTHLMSASPRSNHSFVPCSHV